MRISIIMINEKKVEVNYVGAKLSVERADLLLCHV